MITRSPRDLFKHFKIHYDKLKLDWQLDGKEWSKRILAFFAELGKSEGFDISLRSDYGIRDRGGEETSEHLVDLCWYVSRETEKMTWLELALESELSFSDVDSILEDFIKLVDVKAFMKVGVFMPKLADKDKVLLEIRKSIAYHAIKIPSEQYLVVFLFHHPKEAPNRRMQVDGFEIDYLGNIEGLKSFRAPDRY